MSRRWRRPCSLLTVALSSVGFFLPQPCTWAQGQSPSSCEEDVRRLQADGAERLRRLEALQALLTASEKAWKENQALLETMRKQLHEELAARQASDARKDEELSRASEALRAAKADEARQTARVAELDRAIGELRRQADLQHAERQKLESEVASLRLAESEATRSQAAALAARDAEANRLGERLAQAERDRASALAALEKHQQQLASAQREVDSLKKERMLAVAKARELDRQIAELRTAHEREQTSRADAQDFELALAEERQASQSKLEALESVLQNTRSAGADLRTQLESARNQNAALSRQVEELEASVHKVKELRASVQDESSRLEDLAQRTGDDTAVSRSMNAEEPSLAALPPERDGGDQNLSDDDLREQLSLERERRETLEDEVKRLTAIGDSQEKFVEVWNALQSARSEILVLTHQLAEERQSRESLEVALTRMKEATGAQEESTAEFATRLAETLKERRAEAERLADQLKNANEVIVSLKGHLEAAGLQPAESNILVEVEQEKQRLREALRTAQEANRSLRDKAELATRLAEIVYGKTH